MQRDSDEFCLSVALRDRDDGTDGTAWYLPSGGTGRPISDAWRNCIESSRIHVVVDSLEGPRRRRRPGLAENSRTVTES